MGTVRQRQIIIETGNNQPWKLQLFIAGSTPAGISAIKNARHIVEEFLPRGSTLQIVDLHEEENPAQFDQVLAIPTLIRRQPEPPRRIIGDLGDISKVLVSLGVEYQPKE
jgi:circadian clock protein KaiB